MLLATTNFLEHTSEVVPHIVDRFGVVLAVKELLGDLGYEFQVSNKLYSRRLGSTHLDIHFALLNHEVEPNLL